MENTRVTVNGRIGTVVTLSGVYVPDGYVIVRFDDVQWISEDGSGCLGALVKVSDCAELSKLEEQS